MFLDSHPGGSIATSMLAVSVHTAAMFVVAGGIVFVVYQKVGVDVLRRARINFDLLWVAALALTGLATLSIALYGVVS